MQIGIGRHWIQHELVQGEDFLVALIDQLALDGHRRGFALTGTLQTTNEKGFFERIARVTGFEVHRVL